ncbi:MAG: 5-bromo-4-chloroindolyl phosphate hydrolysis family protein [Paracoccus sp. (in: a-proteobacteria)]
MAQRFGGRFSPDGNRHNHRASGPQQAPVGMGPIRHALEGRPKWITIAATPFLLGAFFQPPAGMVTDLAAFGIMAAAGWLTREGLQAEAAYDARRVARRPAFPRKLFGGILTGLGLAVGSAEPTAFLGAGLIGIAGAVLHWLAFGADPMRDKGMEGVDRFQQDRVARMVDEAQHYLDGMKSAILRTGERRLEARVAMFEATVHDLFRQVEQNPDDLSAARRYMGVYLMGARDATVKFADLYAQGHDPRARQDYEALLADLETNFAARTRALIEGGRTDLDIEIQVLRERLAREGVASPDRAATALESQDARGMEDLLRMPQRAGGKG